MKWFLATLVVLAGGAAHADEQPAVADHCEGCPAAPIVLSAADLAALQAFIGQFPWNQVANVEANLNEREVQAQLAAQAQAAAAAAAKNTGPKKQR